MTKKECPKCGGDMRVELHDFQKYFVCQNIDCEFMEEYTDIYDIDLEAEESL